MALVLAGAVVARFPLFHLVPLPAKNAAHVDGFDAAKTAQTFWTEQLAPACAGAIDAAALRAALAHDGPGARKKMGRVLGLGGSTLFLVRGTGTVKTIEPEGVVVALDGGSDTLRLTTGLVFGNALRDVTGQLEVSSYARSQDFNDLSAQLNAIVETRVAPDLKAQAAVGKRIQFVGVLELGDDADAAGWELVPVKIEWP